MNNMGNDCRKLVSAVCSKLGITRSASERKCVKRMVFDAKGSPEAPHENRRFIRVQAGGYLIARIKGDDVSNIMRILCISYGGALLESISAFQEGQVIDLDIYVPSCTIPMRAKARVARVSPATFSATGQSSCFHMGVEFLEISRTDNNKLFETVNKLIKTENSFLAEGIDSTIAGNTSPARYYSSLRKKYFNHTVRTLIYIMDSIDKSSHKHSENVMRHVTKIARAMRFSKYDILRLKIAALMHDLGKCRIDKAVLSKKGKLTDREWNEIKKHPVSSAVIMNETGIFKEVSNVVRHHHARYKGGGYPDPNIKGIAIPFGSRIIAVADSYDAMVSERKYRKKRMTRNEAKHELERCAGTQFDPRAVAAFI